jgi:cytochrome P450
LNNPDDPFAKAYASIFDDMPPNARVFQALASFFPWLRYIPSKRNLQVKAARKSITKHATKLVRDKEAHAGKGHDILSLMIAENEKAVSEGRLAEIELVDQVMTFLLAGHETTSTAVVSSVRSC